MKVKQIVGEHKKGVRAKIYTKKPQNTIEPAKPKKPEGPVSEDAKITKSDTTGVEITADDGVKTTLPPEKAAALTPDPSNPNEYDLNPTATSPTGDTQAGPKVGANVEIKTAEASGDQGLGTMPTTEYVKGIYAAAAENGMDAPAVEAVKKQMVLAPNGEVDIMATMQKAVQVFQSPEWKQLLADLDALIKKAEAQQASNPELARIQELAGTAPANLNASTRKAASITQAPDGSYTVTYLRAPLSVSGTPEEGKIPPPQTGIKDLATAQRIVASIEKEEDAAMSLPSSIQVADEPTQEDTVSPRLGGYQQTKHDNGDTTDDYSAGPMAVKTRKDAAGNTISTDAQYDLGPNTVKMNQNKVGVKTLSATGPQADQFVGTDASAERTGVDPAKFAAFKKQAGVQESAELTAMLKIAGLR